MHFFVGEAPLRCVGASLFSPSCKGDSISLTVGEVNALVPALLCHPGLDYVVVNWLKIEALYHDIMTIS